MSLKLYNSMSGTKEVFVPVSSEQVTMYACGPTVYNSPHIGNARAAVVFDLLYRVLNRHYQKVVYVRNITDVDDKIIQRANENNEPFNELTERFIGLMHEDERALNIQAPDLEPKATGHITEIIEIIKQLINKDFAYAADNGDVYYAVNKFQDYGKLSRKNPEELLSISLGSTETTFYVLAVYLGAVGIKHSRYAVGCCLAADFAGIFAAICVSYWFFG
mgnify:CR=1 FL=1